MLAKGLISAELTQVKMNDLVLRRRIETCRVNTIPSSLKKCYETGRIDAFKLDWVEGMPNKPQVFWDSDVAKVLEGVGNMLMLHPDSKLEAQYNAVIDLIVASQQEDGYINSFFTCIAPDKRWSDIAGCHELYCAGHLIEAAVAGRALPGGKKLLAAVCKYADYIAKCFGRGPGQMRAYPGHEEIELALVKLYKVTGEKRYFELAKYFIDERGQEPNYFTEVEKVKGGKQYCSYLQADKPVRQQEEAYGHAVRAVYLYSGMADVASLTNDDELFAVCEKMFKSITEKRMYITGGIGSSFQGEALTLDYDLTNGSLMYAESCAAMGLVRFASRMLNATGEGCYADVMERALFNGVLSGISLSGDKFFYTNYLEVDDNTKCYNSGAKERQAWFDCSCCPTSFCRFLPESLQYIWSEGDGEVWLNIPVASAYRSKLGILEVESAYPYDGNIKVRVGIMGRARIALRIPGWCMSYHGSINGEACEIKAENGYWFIEREWAEGDVIEYNLDMPVQVMHSNLKITCNAGRIALMRGPLVYACETADNPMGIANMLIPEEQKFELKAAVGLPEGTVAISGQAIYEAAPEENALYFSDKLICRAGRFTAIPYSLWQNRQVGNMAVWMRCVSQNTTVLQ